MLAKDELIKPRILKSALSRSPFQETIWVFIDMKRNVWGLYNKISAPLVMTRLECE
jgi:hypothetical protein